MRSPLDLFQIIRMKPRLGIFTLPLLKANAEKLQQGSFGKNGFFPGPYDCDLLRREVQNLLEPHLLLADLLFGTLLFAQINNESDALVPTVFGECTTKQYRHAAAIFPEVLLLVRLNDPARP